MWLRGKALSSHALPPDRSLQNRDPTRGARYAGALSQAIGPWSNIGQSSLGGLCGARAYRFYGRDIGRLFRRAGKFPLILLLDSQRGEAGYASKKIVVRLQAGSIEPSGQITPFLILFVL